MLKRLLPRTPLRLYSTIPFDKKPFPFSRFEPCCPDVHAKSAENGFVPCQAHPIPVVLGKKIDLGTDMTRPDAVRHVMGCVGYDAIEWSRAKVESIAGIMQTIMQTENDWLKTHRPSSQAMVMYTVSETPPIGGNKPDVMIFPEFKMIPSVDPLSIDKESPLYSVLNHIWQNPTLPLPQLDQLEDIDADTIILVCTHERRDMRCGKIGPLIVDEFNRVIKEKGLSKVKVWGTSHFGGNLLKSARGIKVFNNR